MKKIHHITKISRLIVKTIGRGINAEEKKNLDQWKDESTKNQQLYNKIVNWDNFQKRNQLAQHFDANRAWEQFSTKMHKKQIGISVKQVLRYAAAIMLPLLLGGAVFYFLNTRQGNIQKEVASINPGTQSATIILDDGKTVNLEDEKLNQLVEKDGSVILNEKGELSYTDIKPEKAKEQLQNTLVVPRGGEYTLVLSDGSRVFLNSVSKLTYPVAFDKTKREVTLEGEAYFEIQRDENRPFYVSVNGVKIEVLGTAFNVKAYNEEEKIYTTLVEGKVKLNTKGNSTEYFLTPDQQAVVEKGSNMVEVKDVDAQLFTGWKNGIYLFSNESVIEIMKILSRWYDFEYEFAHEETKNIKFEGGLNKYESIYPILDILQSTGKLKYKVDGKKIVFMQK
jgi:ferric-dicitrate binding protein FerR (iron transport regulator)